MKKFNLSLVAVLAMSTFAIAGGDIAPVEPVIEEPMVEVSTGAFYIGGAYSYLTMDLTDTTTGFNVNDNLNGLMLQAGYKFNPYIAIEGRYWITSEDTFSNTGLNFSSDAWGIYVKPMFPVTDALDIYALLGYGDTQPEVAGTGPGYDTDGFQWGIGTSYSFTENVAVFVDYVSLYNDTNIGEDLQIDTINVGVTYTF